MDLLANLRKGLASFALTALASTFVVAPVQAANLGFTDDAEIPSWADEAIEELMDQGVISGNDDGSFAPNRQLNRAEVSKIIVLATGIDLDTTGGPHFPDVMESAWYYDYIETMYNQGWINGYPDGYFRPGVGINRAEIAKMVVNAFELDQDLSGAPHFDDVSSADWFYGYVETAYNNGLMRGYGDGTFGPANAVTRAETVKIVYDAQLVVLGPIGPAEGTLEVVLSDDTPRGTNIPFNATSVPFTTVELTASDDADVEISSLTFTRLGLGDNDDFDNVWLEIDGFKVGNDKSINNDDVVELRFNPPIVVPAGQTLVADVVASLKYQLASDGTCYASGSEGCNIGHHNRLALVSAEDIVSTAANLAGDFPIEGEEMEVADYRVSELKFSRLGSDTTVDVGDAFIEIGKFRMLNASTTNKDIEVRAITFKNDGTAELEDDLENVALYVSGEQVSAETIIDGDYITFRLDNGVTGGYIIEDGDSRIFSIRADIVSAERGDVLNFKVDNFEDIVGVEIGTAFGVKAVSGDSNALSFAGSATSVETSTACLNENAEDSCARLRAYEIDAGDINISRDPASLGNQEYAPGSNDVVVLTARIVVDQPVIVDGVRLNVLEASNTTTSTLLDSMDELNNHFDNFRLFLDDKLIDSENEFQGTFGANGVGAYLDFNTSFEIAGTSILKLVANIEDGAATGSRLRMEVQNDAFSSPEFISTGDQVTEVQGSAQASFVEVQESNLIITKSDGLSNGDRIVAGVNDVTFLKFVLDNNDSGDVNATSVTIVALGNGPATTYGNFTAAIFVDGIQQGSSRSFDTNGSATFNDLSVVIPSAGQTEFEVVVDTLETSASSNPAATTLVAGAQSNPSAGTLISASGSAISNQVTVDLDAASPSLIALAAGNDIGIFVNGGTDVLDLDTEIRSLSADVAIGDVELTTTTTFAQSHPTGSDIYSIDYVYPIGSTVFALADASKVEAGDSITIDDGVNSETFTVGSVSGNNITVDATAHPTGSTVALTVGASADEATTDSNIRLMVTNVDADNVENGQTVTVVEGGEDLGSSLDEAVTGNNENCDIDGTSDGTTSPPNASVAPNATLEGDGDATNISTPDSSATNYLCGVRFALVTSGQLTVTEGDTTGLEVVLVANSTNVDVFKLRLKAADDEIQVKDIYLDNLVPDGSLNFGDRVTFKLYNEAGQLLQTKQMAGTELHFELANQDRIRVPKDEEVVVTVKVDVKDITKVNQTAQTLRLALSTNKGTGNKGVDAVTAATGADLTTNDITATPGATDDTDLQSKLFVAYRTTLTFAWATQQPTLATKTSDAQLARFTVTNDENRAADLNRVTVSVTSNIGGTGTAPSATASDYDLIRCKDSECAESTTVTVLDAAGAAGTGGTIVFDGFTTEIDGTAYFAVRVKTGYTTDPDDQNQSITTEIIARDTAPSTDGSGDVVWSDRSNSSGAAPTLNEYGLNFPGAGQQIE